MANQLFRQTALDELSAPERFDEVLRVTSPKHWIVLAAVFLLSAAAAAWGWFGYVTTTADGRALLVRTGSVVSVNTAASGQITEFRIKPGDNVRARQVIARISNPVLAEQVRLAESALAESRIEAGRTVRLRTQTTTLRSTAIERERSNLQQEISNLEGQGRFAAEQVSQQEKLFSLGLITKLPLAEAHQKVTTVHNEIARRRAQLDQLEAERFANEAQPQDANAAALAHVADFERRLTALREELRHSTTVMSPYDGEVVEVKAYAGGVVTAGSPLITVQPRERTLEAIAYIPSSQVKLVRTGMTAKLSPSTVRKEEHGYLRSTVLAVSEYPLTATALMRRLENESLTAALTADGPVTEVRLALETADTEPSGYRWSSSKGPQITLSSGTFCDVQIVTRRQRPLSLILPFLRERLGPS